MNVWNYWFAIALVAPFLWALVNVIDVYFVDGVYEDEFDGAVIMGVFQLIPWLFVPLGIVSFVVPPMTAVAFSFLGGFLFLCSFLFYFRALFTENDVAVIQVLWNLSIPLVPILTFIFLGERLEIIQYLGIGVTFIGAVVFALAGGVLREKFRKVMGTMVVAVVALSASMVLQDRAYAISGQGDFWSTFLVFCLGASVAGVILPFFDSRVGVLSRFRHIGDLAKKYFLVFSLTEIIVLVGTITSQRSIDLSPSVSFIAVIESLVPIFVLIISVLLSVTFLLTNKKLAKRLYDDQLSSARVKITSAVVMSYGIYLIT
jgi:uncharacterized membrane protein